MVPFHLVRAPSLLRRLLSLKKTRLYPSSTALVPVVGLSRPAASKLSRPLRSCWPEGKCCCRRALRRRKSPSRACTPR